MFSKGKLFSSLWDIEKSNLTLDELLSECLVSLLSRRWDDLSLLRLLRWLSLDLSLSLVRSRSFPLSRSPLSLSRSLSRDLSWRASRESCCSRGSRSLSLSLGFSLSFLSRPLYVSLPLSGRSLWKHYVIATLKWSLTVCIFDKPQT